MNINGEKLKTLEVFPIMMTVPDCVVTGSNKIGGGHGEAKLYIASKDEMRAFYGGERFSAKCFLLKNDLISYMEAIKKEYLEPSQEYAKKDKLPELWQERMNEILEQEEVIPFTVQDQYQIGGPRGYVNSSDYGYKLIRKLSLPLVSYIYVEKVGNEKDPLFYWKLFVDFEAIEERQGVALVLKYGKGKQQDVDSEAQAKAKVLSEYAEAIRKARIGQGKYREQLLEQCHFCPITMISDERLLIASHIKPWAISEDNEKIDPYNGYALSPMFDKLFDRGFITFTEDKKVILSDFISLYTWKRIAIKNGEYIQSLPMDEKRIRYLDFHHRSVFKGSYNF